MVDTMVLTWLTDSRNPRPDWERLTKGRTLYLSFVTVGEIIHGAHRWSGARRTAIEQQLASWPVVPGTVGVARKYAELRARYFDQIGDNDLWIAACALREPEAMGHTMMSGFAFDPMAGEEATTLGRLTVLQARMNPDLAMGDELLKKTGSGNLFMVFGEPDIEVKPAEEGKLTVEVCGLDVYDPTTGQLRSSSVDDIAAWFLDTDYDGEAFIVRHAYFTGADDPYDKLRRALRADISDEAWATVNSTISRPFPKPKSGKVAIKVINHYGDEVMKVFGTGVSSDPMQAQSAGRG
jgi:adenine-specific DNA-methyltransferase